jgi:hypothetical protein
MSEPERLTPTNGHGAEPASQFCQWFATCTNLATTERDHPVLGKVPICDRCEQLIKNMGED